MKQDEIIEMAREADIDHHRLWNDDGTNRLESFAKLVAAKVRKATLEEMIYEHPTTAIEKAVAYEREACAKVCEEEGKLWSKAGCTDTQTFALCATVIRARGEA